MSAIADFILLPRTALPHLAEIAGDPGYRDFLRSTGVAAVDFRGSGWVFNTLLSFLSKQVGMNSRNFEFAKLSGELSAATESLQEIYAAKEKTEYFVKLDPDLFSQQVLTDYFNRFNGTKEPDAGKAMLNGLGALRDALARVDDSNVLLLSVG